IVMSGADATAREDHVERGAETANFRGDDVDDVWKHQSALEAHPERPQRSGQIEQIAFRDFSAEQLISDQDGGSGASDDRGHGQISSRPVSFSRYPPSRVRRAIPNVSARRLQGTNPGRGQPDGHARRWRAALPRVSPRSRAALGMPSPVSLPLRKVA